MFVSICLSRSEASRKLRIGKLVTAFMYDYYITDILYGSHNSCVIIGDKSIEINDIIDIRYANPTESILYHSNEIKKECNSIDNILNGVNG